MTRGRETVPQDIAEVLEALRQGLHDHDAGRIVAQFDPQARIFDLAPPLAHPVDREGLASWLEGWDGPVEIEFRDLQATVGGDLAFVHGFTRTAARTRGGADAAWWARATLCLTRRDGRWRIAHQHESVPFYMDGSFKAALDLRP